MNSSEAFHTFEESSRKSIGRPTPDLSTDAMTIGCLQRIASSLESIEESLFAMTDKGKSIRAAQLRQKQSAESVEPIRRTAYSMTGLPKAIRIAFRNMSAEQWKQLGSNPTLREAVESLQIKHIRRFGKGGLAEKQKLLADPKFGLAIHLGTECTKGGAE